MLLGQTLLRCLSSVLNVPRTQTHAPPPCGHFRLSRNMHVLRAHLLLNVRYSRGILRHARYPRHVPAASGRVYGEHVADAFQVSLSRLEEHGISPLLIVHGVRKVLGLQTNGVVLYVGHVGGICGIPWYSASKVKPRRYAYGGNHSG